MTNSDSATMIIPRGTDIAVDGHGQLSIRTPGNLVLQNSGSFGTLESVHGSVRIERGVEIEAATVRCAEACYVQGSLTAWKVIAHTLHLEDTAQAHIVLQETERLDVGRGARLVGNFASEDELFVLFSRFADQVRGLPMYSSSRRSHPSPGGDDADVVRAIAERSTGEGDGDEEGSELPEPLLFARTLLARELEGSELDKPSRRVVQEIVKLLDEGDQETLRSIHRTLFSRVTEPSDGIKKAEWLVGDHFEDEP